MIVLEKIIFYPFAFHTGVRREKFFRSRVRRLHGFQRPIVFERRVFVL